MLGRYFSALFFMVDLATSYGVDRPFIAALGLGAEHHAKSVAVQVGISPIDEVIVGSRATGFYRIKDWSLDQSVLRFKIPPLSFKEPLGVYVKRGSSRPKRVNTLTFAAPSLPCPRPDAFSPYGFTIINSQISFPGSESSSKMVCIFNNLGESIWQYTPKRDADDGYLRLTSDGSLIYHHMSEPPITYVWPSLIEAPLVWDQAKWNFAITNSFAATMIGERLFWFARSKHYVRNSPTEQPDKVETLSLWSLDGLNPNKWFDSRYLHARLILKGALSGTSAHLPTLSGFQDNGGLILSFSNGESFLVNPDRVVEKAPPPLELIPTRVQVIETRNLPGLTVTEL